MKWIPLYLLLVSHSVAGQAREAEDSVRRIVVDFFEGLSAGDLGVMRRCVTGDFTLLEHGEIWNMDTLAALLDRPRPEGYDRQNRFDFFRTEIQGNTAFVSYHNTADISTARSKRTVRWLESAVLVRDGRRWKMKMMHSTRLDP